MRNALFLVALCAMQAAGPLVARENDHQEVWTTRSGYYRISYQSKLDPLTINQIHDWVFHIEDAEGTPVEGAMVRVSGGMPEHNHGLPTSPRMTRSLGDGNYLLSGMRFHMHGFWELTVTVSAGGRQDTAVISFTL